MCFSESERIPRYADLIGKKILKRAEAMVKRTMSWKQNLCAYVCGVCVYMCECVCVCVWNINRFDIIAIIFKTYKKCKSPIKKGL